MGNYDEAVKTVIDSLVLGMPGVKGGKAFGYPAYKVNGKIFAFVGERGIALKFPAERVKELLADQPSMKPFEPGAGVIWREWVSISHDTPTAYEEDVELLEESMLFVGSA